MNILSVAWNIYDEYDGRLEVGRNGFSVMVSNICEYIGRVENSYLLIGDRRLKSCKYGNINLIDTYNELPDTRSKDNMSKWHKGLIKAFDRVVKECNINFVFFHGVGDFAFNCMYLCLEKGIKFACVLHGYLGEKALLYDEKMSPRYLSDEKKVIADNRIPIIAVSNGTKEQILDENRHVEKNRVSVVINGIDLPNKSYNKKKILPKEKIKNKRVLLCVGSFQPRKNQIQLVHAYKLLPEEVSNEICVVFCGVDCRKPPYSEVVKKEIVKNELENSLICIGALSREETQQLYDESDGIIQPSLSEGLSLVVLESICHGKPVIMFEDNPTASDVNSPDAIVLVPGRSDKDLADGIVDWYKKKWDEELIMDYFQYFLMERVAKDYVSYAKQNQK